jgi:hypothetical protein
MTVTELNLALCRALGVAEPERALAVTLVIRPGELPLVRTCYHAPFEGVGERVGKVVHTCHIHPDPEKPVE